MNSIAIYKERNLVITIRLLFVFLPLTFVSCQKYLDKKPVKAQVTPSTLNDLQALFDNQDNINNYGPALLETVADNYFIDDVTYNSYASSGGWSDQAEAQNYIWYEQAIPSAFGWINAYEHPIYTSNVILDQLPKITKNIWDDSAYNAIKGSALFARAFTFQELAQLYCKPYDASTAANDLGLVLRTTSDINAPSVRASVQATYDLILSGLKEAAALLPVNSLYPTRPNKVAAYGELARTYLYMRQYDSAGRYAGIALSLRNTLMDYNNLVPVGSPAIPSFNAEVIFHNVLGGGYFLGSNHVIDTLLYQSYNSNDLRKQVFFRIKGSTTFGLTTYSFQGSYNGTRARNWDFDGITTDELYLIRAECNAKLGSTAAAMTDLNTLMQKRWKNTNWAPFTATSAIDALRQIRTERRKELVWRGQRWADLRRYNMEDSSITLKRIVNGVTYALPPNDKRWVMLIPAEVISRSGIQQNPR
jgi:tetratricopeptide (TPR) repeat protein